jgi:hypothetical protein
MLSFLESDCFLDGGCGFDPVAPFRRRVLLAMPGSYGPPASRTSAFARGSLLTANLALACTEEKDFVGWLACL